MITDCVATDNERASDSRPCRARLKRGGKGLDCLDLSAPDLFVASLPGDHGLNEYFGLLTYIVTSGSWQAAGRGYWERERERGRERERERERQMEIGVRG